MKRRSDCSISYTLDLVGDKWTLLVLRDLIFSRKRYFREFLAAGENIASNILTERLTRLEVCGLVTRQPDPANARQVIYTPTEKGLDMIPALLEIASWGARHDPKSKTPKEFLRRMTKDRAGMIAEARRRATAPD